MNEWPAVEIVCNLADKSDVMIALVDPHVRVLPNELACTDLRLTNTVQEATDVDAAGPGRTQSPVIDLVVWLVANEEFDPADVIASRQFDVCGLNEIARK